MNATRPPEHDAVLQHQARALGDPTRFAIFRSIAASDHPVDVATLAASFGLNHNAVRQHLAKLVHAGLVEEGTHHRGGRGRPRLVYRISAAAAERWGEEGPYERLSVLLTEALASGRSPREVGREWGHRLASGAVADPVDAIAMAMAEQGFDPTVRRRGRRIEVVLQRCPFATAALADRDTVCSLHLGMAEGLAEARAGTVAVEGLTPHDPRRANCRLHLRPAR